MEPSASWIAKGTASKTTRGPLGLQQVVQHVFDADGREVEVTEVTQHFYDGLERRVRTQRYDGDETTYGYDVKGNRTLVRDGAGVETRYTWDSVDRLATATTPVGLATAPARVLHR